MRNFSGNGRTHFAGQGPTCVSARLWVHRRVSDNAPFPRFCHSEAAAGRRGNPFPFSAFRNAPNGDADCRVASLLAMTETHMGLHRPHKRRTPPQTKVCGGVSGQFRLNSISSRPGFFSRAQVMFQGLVNSSRLRPLKSCTHLVSEVRFRSEGFTSSPTIQRTCS